MLPSTRSKLFYVFIDLAKAKGVDVPSPFLTNRSFPFPTSLQQWTTEIIVSDRYIHEQSIDQEITDIIVSEKYIHEQSKDHKMTFTSKRHSMKIIVRKSPMNTIEA